MPSCDERPPDLERVLEEILERREHGESVSRAESVARFPALEAELTEFFANNAVVDAHVKAHRRAARQAGIGRWFENEEEGISVPTPTARIGSFHLLEELGEGGQGVVYKAEQVGTRRTVAVKTIRRGLLASPKQRHRFENEVQVASELSHPNIVTVFECGHSRGHDFFAMEYVDGVGLHDYVQERDLTPRQIVSLFLPICDAVTYAHQRGIIHRDLKPSNVLVDAQGRPHILDFGLAKRLDGERLGVPTITEPGAFAGTWHYASPERVDNRAHANDVRSDVYAIGIMLYEALTDSLPFDAPSGSRLELAEKIREARFPRPSRLRQDIDNDLETIVLQALHHDRLRRYQSMRDLGEDLRRYLSGDAIQAKRDQPWYVLRKFIRRHRWPLGAAAVGVASLAAFAGVSWTLYRHTLEAKATTETQARFGRLTERFLIEYLDGLHGAANVAQLLQGDSARTVALAYLARPTLPPPMDLLNEVALDLPAGCCESVRDPTAATHAQSVAALWEREEPLARLQAELQEKRLDFPVRQRDREWILADSAGESNSASVAARLLADRAWLLAVEGDHTRAAGCLQAASTIAFGLGDGPLLPHKSAANQVRDYLYDTIFLVMESVEPKAAGARDYLRWLDADLPVPSMCHVVVRSTAQVAQQLRDALRADPISGEQYLDLARVNEDVKRYFEKLGLTSEAHRRLARRIDARGLDMALREFVAHPQRAMSWPIDGRSAEFMETASGADAARTFVRAMLPSWPQMLTDELNRKRIACKILARAFRFHRSHGRWPESVQEMEAVGNAAILNDSGVAYDLVGGGPRIRRLPPGSGGGDPSSAAATEHVVYFHGRATASSH